MKKTDIIILSLTMILGLSGCLGKVAFPPTGPAFKTYTLTAGATTLLTNARTPVKIELSNIADGSREKDEYVQLWKVLSGDGRIEVAGSALDYTPQSLEMLSPEFVSPVVGTNTIEVIVREVTSGAILGPLTLRIIVTN